MTLERRRIASRPSKNLSANWAFGRVTIRQAIELLYEEGLLRSHQGEGDFVTRAVERTGVA